MLTSDPLSSSKMISNEYMTEYKLDPDDNHLQEPGSTRLLPSAVDIPPKVDPRDPREINQHLKVTRGGKV